MHATTAMRVVQSLLKKQKIDLLALEASSEGLRLCLRELWELLAGGMVHLLHLSLHA